MLNQNPCISDIVGADGQPLDIMPSPEQPKKTNIPESLLTAFIELDEYSKKIDVNQVAVNPPISASNIEKYFGKKLPTSLAKFLNTLGKFSFISYNFGEGAKGLRNQLPLARAITEQFFGNNVYGPRQMPITIAAEQGKTLWIKKFEKGHQKAFQDWLIANKTGGNEQLLNIDILRTEFSVTVNHQLISGNFLPTKGLTPEEIKINEAINDGIRNYQNFDKEFSQYIEESGIVDFSKIGKRSEWEPIRQYNRTKILQLESKYGKEVMELLFAEAYRNGSGIIFHTNPEVNQKFHNNVGVAIYLKIREGVSPKVRKSNLIHTDGLNKYSSIKIEELSTSILDEINSFNKDKNTGDVGYLKERVKLDEQAEINFKYHVDGESHDVKIKFTDLLSDDLETNIVGMINNLVGRAEIANRFDLNGFKIKNNNDWEVLMGALEYQADNIKENHDTIMEEFNKATDTVNYLYKRSISEWTRNDVPEAVANNLRRLALLTRLHMLGATAVWQILESTKLAALWGLQQAVTASPDLFRHVKDIKDGKISKHQAEAEIMELTGLGEDTLIAHVNALQDAMLISHMGELIKQEGLDRFLHRSNEVLVKYISPVLPITDAYTRLNITLFVRSFSKVLAEIKTLRDNKSSEQDIEKAVKKHFDNQSLTLNRLSNFGMASYTEVTGRTKLTPDFDRFMDIIREMENHVEKSTASWGGKVDKFNLDKWDRRILRDFKDLITAHTWFSILRTEIGDVPKEFDSNIGSTLVTIMRHGFSAHSRNFLHNAHSLIRDRDTYPVKAIALEAAFAWGLIEMLNNLKSNMQDDSEAYLARLKPLLSADIIAHMSNMGMSASWYIALAMMLGYKVGHEDNFKDIIFSPPVLGELDNIFDAVKSLLSISLEQEINSKDVNDIVNATLGNNIIGLATKGALNRMIDY
jgi:hypothetical protein